MVSSVPESPVERAPETKVEQPAPAAPTGEPEIPFHYDAETTWNANSKVMMMQEMINKNVDSLKRHLELRLNDIEDNNLPISDTTPVINYEGFESMLNDNTLFKDFNHGKRMRDAKDLVAVPTNESAVSKGSLWPDVVYDLYCKYNEIMSEMNSYRSAIMAKFKDAVETGIEADDWAEERKEREELNLTPEQEIEMLNKEIKLLGWNGEHEKRIAVLEKLVKKVSKKAL